MTTHLAVECSECGHLHFTHIGYVECPIADCPCPYAAGEWTDEDLDKLARLLEEPPK